MAEKKKPITFEDARILWQNFRGLEKTYNAEGERNFNLVIDKDLAEQMADDGWNVKCKLPREEGDEPLCHMEVKVSFKGRFPPRIVLINSGGQTDLDEETVGLLDQIRYSRIDLIINPSEWDVNGKRGIKAYLKSIYVTQDEDVLEAKYNLMDGPEQSAPMFETSPLD